MRDAILFAMGLVAGFVLFVATEPQPHDGPRLIAQGCAFAGGDLWASEESDFPTPCENVERWQ